MGTTQWWSPFLVVICLVVLSTVVNSTPESTCDEDCILGGTETSNCPECEDCCLLINETVSLNKARELCHDHSPTWILFETEGKVEDVKKALKKKYLENMLLWTGGVSCQNNSFWRNSRTTISLPPPEEDSFSECRYLAFIKNIEISIEWTQGNQEGHVLCCEIKTTTPPTSDGSSGTTISGDETTTTTTTMRENEETKEPVTSERTTIEIPSSETSTIITSSEYPESTSMETNNSPTKNILSTGSDTTITAPSTLNEKEITNKEFSTPSIGGETTTSVDKNGATAVTLPQTDQSFASESQTVVSKESTTTSIEETSTSGKDATTDTLPQTTDETSEGTFETSRTVTSSEDPQNTVSNATELFNTATIGDVTTQTENQNSKKPNTETTPVSTITTTQTLYCKERSYKGVLFPETVEGNTSIVNCSEGYVGNASWKCGPGPNFIGEPNFKCDSSKQIQDFYDKLKNPEQALNLSTELSKWTEKPLLNLEDFKNIMDIIAQMLSNFNWENSQERNNFTNNVLNATSNIISEDNSDGWNEMDKDKKLECFGSVLEAVDNLGENYMCSDSSPQKKDFHQKNFDFQIMPVKNSEETIFSSDISSNRITLGASTDISKCSKAVGVLYKKAHFIFPTNNVAEGTVLTPVIGLSVGKKNDGKKFPKVTIVLENSHSLNLTFSQCGFWKNNNWSTEGCQRVFFNDSQVVCECNHLTNFAVLMTRDTPIPKNRALEITSIICCGVSILALILTIACLTGFRSLRCRRSTITCNLCAALLAANCLILVGLERKENVIVCTLITIALHYSLLSAAFWMLLEGFILYQLVVVVFSKILNIPIAFFYAVGYGFPLLIVALSAGIRFHSYVNKNYCWLGIENGMVYSFLGPLALVILINTTIFIIAMRTAVMVRHKKIQKTQPNTSPGWIKGAFSMMCILGTSWILTFFYFGEKTDPILYIFNILNASQGTFIFLMNVVFNEKTRTTLLRFYRGKLFKVSTSHANSSTRIQRISGGSQQSSKNAPTAPPMNANLHI